MVSTGVPTETRVTTGRSTLTDTLQHGLEPLLRYILGKPMLRGIQLPEVQTTKRHWPTILEKAVDDMPPLKLLSYADDLQVFLNDTKEWKALLYILDLYGKASNAKVNLSKTIVISMSGKTHIEWT
jgi:hypothetical protein